MAKGVLLSLRESREIGRAEFFAGLEWQFFFEKIQLQPMRSLLLDEPVYNQPVYQADGVPNEIQEMAHDFRIECRKALGREFVAFLDHCLCADAPSRKHRGDLIIALHCLSEYLGMAARADDDGMSPEHDDDLTDWIIVKMEKQRLREVQPHLFDKHRRKPGSKLRANKL